MLIQFKKTFRSVYYFLFEGRTIKMEKPAELFGSKWIISRRAGYSYANGRYELPVQEFLRQTLTLNDVFWDVGAHVGFFSLFSAKLVGAQGKVVSFEPDPNNFRFLADIHHLNGAPPNWYVKQAALSDLDGQMRFAEGSTSSTGRLDSKGAFCVDCLRVDSIWRDQGKPAVRLLKIDVEGFAGAVLRGAKELLIEARPILLLELHDKNETDEVLAALPGCYFRDRAKGIGDATSLNDGLHVIFRPNS